MALSQVALYKGKDPLLPQLHLTFPWDQRFSWTAFDIPDDEEMPSSLPDEDVVVLGISLVHAADVNEETEK